jgi:hypothetical protein
MKSKTIVCAYSKNEPIERAFERLLAMYTSNYSDSYTYCVLIDLPDGISYRMAGDSLLEDEAQRLFGLLNGKFGNRLICAVRQRRSSGDTSEGKYVCEGGARGALATLWRHSKGKDDGLFPIFGCDETQGAERIYFSRPEMCMDAEHIDVIEPSGIFRLASKLQGFEAVFAFTGEMECDLFNHFEWNDPGEKEVFEGLYSSVALDKIICATRVDVRGCVISEARVIKYPSGSFVGFCEGKKF